MYLLQDLPMEPLASSRPSINMPNVVGLGMDTMVQDRGLTIRIRIYGFGRYSIGNAGGEYW